MLMKMTVLCKNTASHTLLHLFMTIIASAPLLATSFPRTTNPAGYRRQMYMIQVAEPENYTVIAETERQDWYRTFMTTGDGPSRIVHSYSEVFTGFAAQLNKSELKAIKRMPGFVRAFPDEIVPLSTTRTPEYIGLQLGSGLWRKDPPGQGAGVIIAVLDTGFTPSHPSFRDDIGMPSPPSRWRGSCEAPVVCNNKIVGARTLVGWSVHDDIGHGTHTASTAAGAIVDDASFFGLVNGSASGIAPRAHLAIYKVCPYDYCFTSAILAGMDAAVADGADVLSISFGAFSQPYHSDAIAIGAYGAMKKGRFVSCAAGNDGTGGISNEAPWILTVGASTFDRRLSSTVNLGDGRVFQGESAFQPGESYSPVPLPVVFPGAVFPPAAYCQRHWLISLGVRGKGVVCQRNRAIAAVDQALWVREAGGAAMILTNDDVMDHTLQSYHFPLPASLVSFTDGNRIKEYATSSSNPSATILFGGTMTGVTPSPVVASFSSKGPSIQSPMVLKPDILGPGVNILAAWPSNHPPHSPFNILSGTSMSTPHLSGVAALLKSFHPDWSPAAIKSAILTTADFMDRSGSAIKNEHFDVASVVETGSGHVNPNKANDPGLVYDVGEDDYTRFLCGLGYSDVQVRAVVGVNVSCATVGRISQSDLNYPSITVSSGALPLTVKRTVTNVGKSNETYLAVVEAPPGVSVDVNPPVLAFTSKGQKKNFTVRFSLSGPSNPGDWVAGTLKWVSPFHEVRSPLAIAAVTPW